MKAQQMTERKRTRSTNKRKTQLLLKAYKGKIESDARVEEGKG